MERINTDNDWKFTSSQPLFVWGRIPSDIDKSWKLILQTNQSETIKLPYGLEFALQIHDSKIPNKLEILVKELPEGFPVCRLYPYWNNQKDIDLMPLNKLKSLTHLILYGQDVIGKNFEDIRLPNLEVLELQGCELFDDASVPVLLRFNSLRGLNLNNCPITGKSLGILATLQSLEELHIKHCQITDDGLKELQKYKKLTAVYLSGCNKITDLGVKHLNSINNLKEISLDSCLNITDDAINYLAVLRGLESLNLGSCSRITDLGIGKLKDLSSLRKLNVSNTSITDKSIFEIIKMPNLTELNLDYCANISEQGLVLLPSLNHLQKLQISGYGNISDESITFLSNFTDLVELDLCDRTITDKCLFTISSLNKVSKLNLFGCKGITDGGLSYLLNLPTLGWLNVAESTGLSQNAVDEIKKKKNILIISHGLKSNINKNLNIASEVKMQKWEYKEYHWWRGTKGGFSSDVTNWDSNFDFNQLGHEGWELVSAIPLSSFKGEHLSGLTSNVTFIFKRPSQ